MNQDENSPWQYKPDNGSNASPGPQANENDSEPVPRTAAAGSVAWQAAEFIEHPHGRDWYTALAVTTALLSALVYLTTKDFFATGTIIVVGAIVWVFAGHKPQLAQYEITDSGLVVNSKTYPYSSFKSFAVLHEGSLTSVNLFPLKRLMPPITAYFDPKDEPKIVEALGSYLPYEERKMDSVDRLSRRLRL
jgi:hypothetical protein